MAYLLEGLVSILFLFGVNLQLLKFKILPQALDLWNMNVSLKDIIFHPHMPRYLLVYPLLEISQTLGVNPDAFFSSIMAILVLISAYLSIKISRILLGKPLEAWLRLSLMSFFIVLSIFMNGRGVYAMLGFLLLTLAMLLWEKNTISKGIFITYIGLAVWLSSVSSGTLTAVIVALSMWLLFRVLKSIGYLQRRDFMLLLYLCVIFSVPVVFYLKTFIVKNTEYYGGGSEGVIGMLDHGLGGVSHYFNTLFQLESGGVFLSCLLLMCCGLMYVFFLLSVRPWRLISYLIGVVLLFGMFGLFTLAMVIPFVGIVFAVMLSKKTKGLDCANHSVKILDSIV